MVKIAPSLLSADFANLAEELKDIERGGADLVHLDIMDGHFVPNLTFGAPIIKALRPHTNLTFDAHLMVYHPENYVKPLADAGVNMVSFHVEAAPHADRIVYMLSLIHIFWTVRYIPRPRPWKRRIQVLSDACSC